VRRPRIASLAVAALASVVAGCGNERAQPPRGLTSALPEGKQQASFPGEGIAFSQPANWSRTIGEAPLVTIVFSGRAAIAVWRYPRREALPDSAPQLERARRALIAAARARDRTLEVTSSRVTRVRGVRAVELVGTEQVGLARRRVRSTHLYGQGAEIVVDAYAPPGEFDRLDRTAFLPLTASLRLSRPLAP